MMSYGSEHPFDGDGNLGVAGGVSFLFRSQNPALGPFIMKASVHRDSPRSESCSCQAAVSSVANESTNAALDIAHISDE